MTVDRMIYAIFALFVLICHNSNAASDCRRTDTADSAVKKSGSRYVKVSCYGKNLTTLNSDFLQEIVIGPPEHIVGNKAGKGVVHDVGKTITPIYQVTLENSNIIDIQDGAFNAIPTLQVLNLKSNMLDKIKLRTFEGLKALQDLSLDRNKISVIQPSSFSNMKNLKYLTFSENLLQEVTYFTFRGLKQSNHLSLDYNNISVLHAGSFASLPNLENLYLSYNKISKLDGGILAGLRKLKYLFLSGNNIKTILDGAFRSSSSLVSLDLSNNLLSEVKRLTFDGLTYLERLSLRNNEITHIDDGAFQGLPLLTELDLSHNALVSMRPSLLWGLINLQYFYVVSNQMQETTMLSEDDPQLQDLTSVLGLICRKRGLHYADVRGNGFYDMIQRSEIARRFGYDITMNDQHKCIL